MADNTRKEIPQRTKFALWGKAAGCCELCTTPLWEDNQYHLTGNFSNFAHIRAYSPNGPRYDSSLDTPEKKNDIDNLMLLCQSCHKVIDDNPDEYSVERLQEEKRRREHAVRSTISSLAIPHANVLRCSIPIDGRSNEILDCEWRRALSSVGLAPASEKAFDLYADSQEYARDATLTQLADNLLNRFSKFSESIKDDSLPTAVFAIAPQPLLVQLGFLIGGAEGSTVFQRRRDEPHWQWSDDASVPEFDMILTPGQICDEAMLVLSISGEINEDSISTTLSEANCPKMRISVKNGGSVDVADSRNSLLAFRVVADKALYAIHERYPNVKRLHVFPAMPISFNVALGQAFNSNAIDEYFVYQKKNGTFSESLKIKERL